MFTNIFIGVCPQRRNAVLSFSAFDFSAVTSFFITFIESSPTGTSPAVLGFLGSNSHVFKSFQLCKGQQRRMISTIFFCKTQVIWQEVLQLLYVVQHDFIGKGWANKSIRKCGFFSATSFRNSNLLTVT